MVKILVILMLAVVLGSFGHIYLSKGMKEVERTTAAVEEGFRASVARAVTNKWVLLGILGQAAFFFLYTASLAKADVSFALPVTAVGYILVAILAKPMLGETITLARWIGTVVIMAGVVLVGRS